MSGVKRLLDQQNEMDMIILGGREFVVNRWIKADFEHVTYWTDQLYEHALEDYLERMLGYPFQFCSKHDVDDISDWDIEKAMQRVVEDCIEDADYLEYMAHAVNDGIDDRPTA